MNELGRALVGLGFLLAVVGGSLLLAGGFGLRLGRLPGDIAYQGKHFSVYYPLGTCILVSIVLTAMFCAMSRLGR
jgi:hypothetical protein